MSHFSVAVITRKEPTQQLLEDILSPYSEHLTVPPYIRETPEQYLKEERENLEYYRTKGSYAEYIKNPEEYVKKYEHNPGHIEYVKNFMEKHYVATDEELLAKRAQMYPSWDSEELEMFEPFFDKDGNLISYYNPLSKWDWWVIGGRWSGIMELKNGELSNSAQVKDINFHQDLNMEELKNNPEIVKEYDDIVNGKSDSLYRKEYLMELYPTIEDYIRAQLSFHTFAVIDEFGNWNEKGKMYMFGVSSDTPEENRNWDASYYDTFLKHLRDDWYVTIIDCHI